MGSQEKLRETIQALLEAPVAVCTSEANEQHYEVDARFYGLCLGPHRKYSACLHEGAEPKWPGNKLQKDAARLLPKAENDSLDQVASRGDITQSTKAILDCGCGWGSASLYLADRFRNAQVVGVSNSHSQRRYIMGQAQERGLTNLQIVTLDLSKEPLTKALEALQSRLPGQYFERGVSIEMFEHMKNYKALFEKITAVLEDQGGSSSTCFAIGSTPTTSWPSPTRTGWPSTSSRAGPCLPPIYLSISQLGRMLPSRLSITGG